MSDELIERVAKAICATDWSSDTFWVNETIKAIKDNYRKQARAALEASGHAELLAACKAMRNFFHHPDGWNGREIDDPDLTTVDAAIAKAEGSSVQNGQKE